MKWRVVAALVGLTAIVLLVQDVPLASYLYSIENNRIITELQRDAFVIAGRSENALSNGNALDNTTLNDMVTSYGDASGATVVVVDENAILVAASEPGMGIGRSFKDRPEIHAALKGDTAAGVRDSTTLNTELLYVAVPVLSGPDTLGAVRLTYPASQVDARVNRQLLGLGLVALLTMLVATVVAFLLAGTITRPLRRLQSTTAQLASGDLSARATTGVGAPEIRSLAVDLNTMANRLDGLLEAQKSFAADASHQLRTPLTALRLRLDQAAESLDGGSGDAEALLDAARTETERLQRVIDGLLHLARAEGSRHQLIQLDIAKIARERVTVWQPLAEEQNITLEVTTPESCTIWAFDGAPDQILDNYIDNAISVSEPNATVSVQVGLPTDRGARRTVVVSDSGPGLNAEQRARAFDRFWRDRADNAGTGLGLAIVSQLAQACGAEVELRESATGGIDAVVVFRAAP